MGPSLRNILARVGAEKKRARAARTGAPADGDLATRVLQSLELYEQLSALRAARLIEELGAERAAREQRRADERLAEEQEASLLRMQRRLYGKRA